MRDLEHLFVYEHRPRRSSGGHHGDGHEIRRKRWPWAIVNLGYGPESVARNPALTVSEHRQGISFNLDLHSEPGEAQESRVEMLDGCSLHYKPAPGNGGEAYERPSLDVVGPDGEGRAAELPDSLNEEAIGTDSLDASAHLIEEVAQILDVGLGCHIPEQ